MLLASCGLRPFLAFNMGLMGLMRRCTILPKRGIRSASTLARAPCFVPRGLLLSPGRGPAARYRTRARDFSSTTPVPSLLHGSSTGGTPCFAGEGTVKLPGGATKAVSAVLPGDVLATADGKSTLVRFVLKSLVPAKKLALVTLPAVQPGAELLRITPWHPIRTSQKTEWLFPSELREPLDEPCEAVYSFVLESGHVVNVSGYECVTLGNLFSDTERTWHPYFSSQDVVDDLVALSAGHKSQGFIEITPDFVRRDTMSGTVYGIVAPRNQHP
jgi:hypothetical protein